MYLDVLLKKCAYEYTQTGTTRFVGHCGTGVFVCRGGDGPVFAGWLRWRG